MTENTKKMAKWSSMGSRWLQRPGPSGPQILNCFMQTDVFSCPYYGMHVLAVHLAAALLFAVLGGEPDHGDEAAEKRASCFCPGYFCLGRCAWWLPKGWWEHMGGPKFTRLKFVAQDVGERLLAVN